MSKTIQQHLAEQRSVNKPDIEDIIEGIEDLEDEDLEDEDLEDEDLEEIDEALSLIDFVGLSSVRAPSGYETMAYRNTLGKAAYPVMLSKELSINVKNEIVSAIKSILKRKS